MTRYIAEGDIYDLLQTTGTGRIHVSQIDVLPRADVVPKSEYENLKSQFEALDHECDRLERAESNRHDAIEQAKTEVASEIFEELEYHSIDGEISINSGYFAELKKKYTEDHHDSD